MTLELLDDGVGLGASGVRNGTGLRNTRERLTHLYGDAGQLEIMSRSTGGTLVRVMLPFRREPDPLASEDVDARPASSDAQLAQTASRS